ncbi:MAG: CNNM domain-containing protein [Verrucomicrobiales bacterium]
MSVAALCVCLALSFLLSGLESALFTVSIVRVRHRAKDAPGRRSKEQRLEKVMSRRRLLLTAVLLTNNALALVAFIIATGLLVEQYSEWGYWIAFIVSLPVYIFGCELVPKSLFARFPYRMLRFFVPVLELINLTVGQFLRLVLLIKPDFQEESQRLEDEIDERARSRAEFRSLAKIISRDGTMDPAEKEMIDSVMNFRRTRIGDLMLPLAEVTAIPLDMSAEQIIKLSRETGLEEFPVMSKTGDLIGIVSAVEIMRESPGSTSAVNFLRRLLRARLDEPASSLVPRLRKAGLRVAAVCTDDSSRTTLGIVSLDDIFQRMLQKPLP